VPESDKENADKYLKLNVGDKVRVHAKDSAMQKLDALWYGECNSSFGYFPKRVVNELKVLNENLVYVVPSMVSLI
jgi:hypothetical protein